MANSIKKLSKKDSIIKPHLTPKFFMPLWWMQLALKQLPKFLTNQANRLRFEKLLPHHRPCPQNLPIPQLLTRQKENGVHQGNRIWGRWTSSKISSSIYWKIITLSINIKIAVLSKNKDVRVVGMSEIEIIKSWHGHLSRKLMTRS